jgi:hypothetical protein
MSSDTGPAMPHPPQSAHSPLEEPPELDDPPVLDDDDDVLVEVPLLPHASARSATTIESAPAIFMA